MNILLVEDNPDLGEAIEARLRGLGHQVTWNMTGESVPETVASDQIDAVVLDLTLPSGDGMAILRGLRRARLNLPVLVITARAEIDDKVSLLDLGADDYLVKPFDLREFEARLRAVMRRPSGQGSSVVELGRLRLDQAGQLLWLDGMLVEMGAREFRLLESLISAPGRVTTRDRLMARLGDLEDGGSENALEQIVSRVRRKIAGSGVQIVTVRGVGYMAQDEGPRG